MCYFFSCSSSSRSSLLFFSCAAGELRKKSSLHTRYIVADLSRLKSLLFFPKFSFFFFLLSWDREKSTPRSGTLFNLIYKIWFQRVNVDEYIDRYWKCVFFLLYWNMFLNGKPRETLIFFPYFFLSYQRVKWTELNAIYIYCGWFFFLGLHFRKIQLSTRARNFIKSRSEWMFFFFLSKKSSY